MAIGRGERVRWSWGQGEAEGVVTAVHHDRVELTIKGTDVARDADPDNPAYTIRQDDGDVVLKSASEVRKT